MQNSQDLKNDVYTQLQADFIGKYALGTKGTNTLEFLSIENGRMDKIMDVEGHNGPITSVTFAQNSRYIVTSDFTGYLIFWEIANDNLHKRFEKQITENGPVYDTAILTGIVGNQMVFCACENGLIKLLDINNFIEQSFIDFKADEDAISCVDANQSFLITASFANALKFTEICNNRLMESKTIDNFDDEITSVKITRKNCFEQTFLAVSHATGKLSIYEYTQGEFTVINNFNLKGEIYALDWAQGGFSLSVLYGQNEVKVFEIGETNTFEEVECEDYKSVQEE